MNYEQILSEYLERNPRTPLMCDALQRSWTKFAAYCLAREVEFKSLVPRHVDDFLQVLQWEPAPNGRLYSANTVDLFLRCTRCVLRWATAAGHLRQDPSRGLVLSRPPQPTQKYLTWMEVQAVLRAADRSTAKGLRDAAVLATLTEANLEVRDCLAMNLGDQAKLPLETPTRDLLEAYIQNARPLWVRPATPTKILFLNPYGGRLSPQTVTNSLRAACQLAGLHESVSLKCLRRSYWAAIRKASEGRLPSSFNRNL